MIETRTLCPGVTLRCFRDDRFKQACLSIQMIRPMRREEAALNALLPAVLLRGCRNYPDLRFWEIAGQEGCQVLFGCDAHAPQHVCDLESHEKAQKIAAHCGLTLLEDVPLRPIR